MPAEVYARVGAERGVGKEDSVSMSSAPSRGESDWGSAKLSALLGR